MSDYNKYDETSFHDQIFMTMRWWQCVINDDDDDDSIDDDNHDVDKIIVIHDQ